MASLLDLWGEEAAEREPALACHPYLACISKGAESWWGQLLACRHGPSRQAQQHCQQVAQTGSARFHLCDHVAHCPLGRVESEAETAVLETMLQASHL